MRLPADAIRDSEKLTKFLEDVEITVNRLIKGVKKQTTMTSNELVARPTYAEEFQNIRENVHKVVLSSLPEDWVDEATKSNVRRSRTYRNVLDQ